VGYFQYGGENRFAASEGNDPMTNSPATKVAGRTLFAPLAIRDITLANRIAVSPMCEYSSDDGFANDWHLVHLGSRAVGGAGLVMTEASAVEADGRITTSDLGLWKPGHIEPLKRITSFIKSQGSVAGIQLAHAGRKASTHTPWDGGGSIAPGQPNGWQVAAPSEVPFFEGDPVPRELTTADIQRLVAAFAAAAQRALAAGFEVIEIHGAHGYLIHQFLSPLSNFRTDEYGGSLENRMRMALEIVTAVRREMGLKLPLFLRISATDWTEGGWTLDDSVELARRVKTLGVDLIDASSGGNVAGARIPVEPGYQVAFAERIRNETGLLTGAVGLITTAEQAESIIQSGQADLVLLAREFLRDPNFPMHAAQTLGVPVSAPKQYLRAFPNSIRRG
jgi:2,4-dienoyl-CoA reductase-like NADH-dependent reductase (Old Yellow Enzyme family)